MVLWQDVKRTKGKSFMKYHFILATKEFLFKVEPVEEVLRERAHYYSSHNKQVDFWILPSPDFLKPYKQQIKKITNTISDKDLVAVLSTDADFIYWLKLRYQNVISGSFNAPSDKIAEPLAYN